jgi:hypothetical protein
MDRKEQEEEVECVHLFNENVTGLFNTVMDLRIANRPAKCFRI